MDRRHSHAYTLNKVTILTIIWLIYVSFVGGWQLQTCTLSHLYYLCTIVLLFPDSSLSRICNALNAFSLLYFSQDIPFHSQFFVSVWQYKSHFTTKQPFLSHSSILYKQAISATFVKTFFYFGCYLKQALLLGCISTLYNYFFYCCLTAFSLLGCI